jgi:hypothetical protein
MQGCFGNAQCFLKERRSCKQYRQVLVVAAGPVGFVSPGGSSQIVISEVYFVLVM